MSDDPFAALEQAVSAVEQAAAGLSRQRDTLQNRLEDQRARAETLQSARSGDLDGEARLALLESERKAIRERLRRVREQLAQVSLATPESPAS